jgi:bacillithiol system protein YtxJ
MIWKNISTEQDWKDALSASFTQPVAIFKHSTRCSVSMMAKRQLEYNWNFTEQEVQAYFLDLLQHRTLSNRIAEETQVHHESPQLILLKDGKVLIHASHNYIDTAIIAQQIQLNS